MTVAGMSPLAMMSMHEQYPWMKEKKSSRKQQIQGRRSPLILLSYFCTEFYREVGNNWRGWLMLFCSECIMICMIWSMQGVGHHNQPGSGARVEGCQVMLLQCGADSSLLVLAGPQLADLVLVLSFLSLTLDMHALDCQKKLLSI